MYRAWSHDEVNLPPWIINFREPQNILATLKLRAFDSDLSADVNFPTLRNGRKEPVSGQNRKDSALQIRGLYVRYVTGVFDIKLPEAITTGQDNFRILECETGGPNPKAEVCYSHVGTGTSRVQELSPLGEKEGDESITINQERDISTVRTGPEELPILKMLNTSWAPWNADVGDIIIVIPECDTPLVLRLANEGMYQFIGGVWLVDSALIIGEDEEGDPMIILKANPGFSRLMYGAACEGKTLEGVELFRLC